MIRERNSLYMDCRGHKQIMSIIFITYEQIRAEWIQNFIKILLNPIQICHS